MSRQPLSAAAAITVWSLVRCVGLAGAQETGSTESPAWNGPEVLELVALARRARETLATSTDLQTYEARTEGHVYFFLDPEQGERTLIRVDQIASEVRWMAPDYLRQRVVGERSETRLPVRDFDYYLDRLTLVPHGFADGIEVGSGHDVQGVPHPFAPALRHDPSDDDRGAEAYDFLLGQSLALSVPGRSEPIRIQEIAVRIRNLDAPGILGTVHVDVASGSIVRMAFTFTPASYVDPRNERISVELDYGLWEGRYWLPNEQRIEVRREMPTLDIGVGTVIRAVLQVRDYTFNAPLPESFPSLPGVVFAPVQERRSYPFSVGLYDRMEEDDLSDLVVDPNLNELRARAVELLATAAPSGVSPLRFRISALSSAVRHDRVEGLRIGVGGSLRPSAGVQIRGDVGYPTAEARPQGTLRIERSVTPAWTVAVATRLRGLDGLGLSPGSAPLLSTFGALARGEDYLDPYWVSAGGFSIEHQANPSRAISFAMSIERHSSAKLKLSSAPLDGSRGFRPVRAVTGGEFFRLDIGLRQSLSLAAGGRGLGTIRATLLRGQEGGGIGILSEVEERWGAASRAREIELRATSWNWLGDPLPQGHRLLGGRGTVPGFPYRQWIGRHALAASLIGSTDGWGPWIRFRTGLHAGWSDGGDPLVEEAWKAESSGGPRTSVSIGLGLAWDIVRLDLARGLGGGEWQLLFSFDRRWWDRL